MENTLSASTLVLGCIPLHPVAAHPLCQTQLIKHRIVLRSRELLQPMTPILSHSRSRLSEINFQIRRKGTPVRFTDPQKEDQLLLQVEPFPEKRLATNQDPVLTDLL